MAKVSADQVKSQSGFGAASTADDVIKGVNLKGKTVIVTGGAGGIGLETTRVLVGAGAEVVVGVRDLAKGQQNLAACGLNGRVTVRALDLADPESIDEFAKQFLAAGKPLDILINNAGVMACPLARDKRGYEMQLSTNHYGHARLTSRLLAALKSAGSARVVCLSSRRHNASEFVFADPHFRERAYDRWLAYGQSKTANALFALSLDAKYRSSGIRAFSVHPGIIVATDLNRWTPREQLIKEGRLLGPDGAPILDPLKQLKTIAQGAATTVWAATTAFLADKGGLYLENCNISPLVDAIVDVGGGRDAEGFMGVARYAVDEVAAERLWALTATEGGAEFA